MIGEDGVTEYWIMKDEDPESPESLYTIGNLQVNPALTKEPSKLGFRLADGSEDKETADALKAAFTEEAYTLNPNVQKRLLCRLLYRPGIAGIQFRLCIPEYL